MWCRKRRLFISLFLNFIQRMMEFSNANPNLWCWCKFNVHKNVTHIFLLMLLFFFFSPPDKRFSSHPLTCVYIFAFPSSRLVSEEKTKKWKQKYLHSLCRSNKSWNTEYEWKIGSFKWSERANRPNMSQEKVWKAITMFFERHRMLRGMVAYSVLWPGWLSLWWSKTSSWVNRPDHQRRCLCNRFSIIIHINFNLSSFKSLIVGSMVQQTFEGKSFPNYDWAKVLR